MIYLFNCNRVATRWQLFSTHIHTNNTGNVTKQTSHRITQKNACKIYELNRCVCVCGCRKKKRIWLHTVTLEKKIFAKGEEKTNNQSVNYMWLILSWSYSHILGTEQRETRWQKNEVVHYSFFTYIALHQYMKEIWKPWYAELHPGPS
jgi:phage terminase large subunit-like protein